MSTRARIYVELDENTKSLVSSQGFGKSVVPHQCKFAHIYCHHDGYIDGVGETLLEHYNTHHLALELVSNGYTSTIKDTIETCDWYSNDETFEKPSFVKSPYKSMKQQWDVAYCYLFTKENGWEVYQVIFGKLIKDYVKGTKLKYLGKLKDLIKSI